MEKFGINDRLCPCPNIFVFTVHFVGTALAAVRENLPTSRRKNDCFLFPILRLLLRKIHLLCQRRLFLPRDFGVSRELSGFNGSFFRREQAPALLLTVNSALLIIGFRATTPGRPYFIFGHSEAYPKFRITHCEFRIVFTDSRKGCPYETHCKNKSISVPFFKIISK